MTDTPRTDAKEMQDKYYKIIKDGASFHGGDFDWKPYLPKVDGSPGEWTPDIPEVRQCEAGYHVTKFPNMWFEDGAEVYEVETRGLIVTEGIGVETKAVCRSVCLVRRVELHFGNRNTGYRNTGDYNTGNRNTGDCNTGNCNTGNCNTGNCNTGYSNTGSCNTGDRNTGSLNTGYRNTGDCNTGDCNTGDCNTGNSNTGNWNTGNRHTGSFNSQSPQYFEMFNRPVPADTYRAIRWPHWLSFASCGGRLYFASAFEGADRTDLEATLRLPNFDFKVFEEITGITKADFDRRLSP